MTLAIMGGIVLVGVSIAAAAQVGAPHVTWLAWPGLFLSLAWNFWEFGAARPGGGLDVGWVICGVVFTLMGAGPLIGGVLAMRSTETPKVVAKAANQAAKVAIGATVPPPLRTSGPVKPGRAGSGRSAWGSGEGSGRAPAGNDRPTSTSTSASTASEQGAPPGDDEDLVDGLERLAGLHRAGSLSDDEFAAAKARLIGGAP
jgi:hypothetical protein